MSYLGKYQLGATIPLTLQSVDATPTPQLPTRPPQYKVFSGTTLVAQGLMPIEDRYVVTGFFHFPLFLDRLYATGFYQVVYFYNVGAFYGIKQDNFEIVPGGDVRGAVDSMYFYERPEANYVVQGTENGSILKGRNPTV